MRNINSHVRIALLLLCPVFSACSEKKNVTSTNPESKVWVCTGGSSKRFHAYNNCKGLSKCSASIDEVTLEEAEMMGRTPCRKCYKK